SWNMITSSTVSGGWQMSNSMFDSGVSHGNWIE
ncbi:hypothetical protein G210_2658, partial [Candida maltosa Xu316]